MGAHGDRGPALRHDADLSAGLGHGARVPASPDRQRCRGLGVGRAFRSQRGAQNTGPQRETRERGLPATRWRRVEPVSRAWRRLTDGVPTTGGHRFSRRPEGEATFFWTSSGINIRESQGASREGVNPLRSHALRLDRGGTMRRILSFMSESCTGCRICEAMCSFAHGSGLNPIRARLRILREDEYGRDLPAICHHCEDPPCAKACPSEAVFRDPETGAVLVREEECIGCLACVDACPHGAISWDDERQAIVKCDLCRGHPTCVASCPKGALKYEPPDGHCTREQGRKPRPGIATHPGSMETGQGSDGNTRDVP
jgi:anaerobic carbon-monoxide dehydrogenase iron sulfur subunit